MTKVTRRAFSLSIATAAAAYLVGCDRQLLPGGNKAALKMPQNADDIANLFQHFADPAFGFDDAKTGLGLIGEAKVNERDKQKRYEFADQSESVRAVELATPLNEQSLTEIEIQFRRNIEVSLKRLEHHLGVGKGIDSTSGVGMLSVPAVRSFTNIVPGGDANSVANLKSRFPSMYEFVSGKARLQVFCTPAESNVKIVSTLRMMRSI